MADTAQEGGPNTKRESVTSSNNPMEGSTCIELALEGEKLCKAGDCRGGVQFFEAAIQAGTDDLRTLSAIYSQLGNAYFYLTDYRKALDYHKLDLTLARGIGDKLGAAKAAGNLGTTLKVLGKYEEAVGYCKHHLDLSRELGDKVGEARALYNLGNVYHTCGKVAGRVSGATAAHPDGRNGDPGDFPQHVKDALVKAAQYYQENLVIVRQLGDRAGQGRACGNLGNTHYLLGNFTTAIEFHTERLTIAKEFGDKSAERRAHSNLGNAQVFLGNFDTAADNYKQSLSIGRALGDRALEAQACFSLGNTYTLLRDYPRAVDYYRQHLNIARQLADRVGEARACWSLGNAYLALGENKAALHYATLHLDLSKQIGDSRGEETGQAAVAEIQEAIRRCPGGELSSGSARETGGGHTPDVTDVAARRPARPGQHTSHHNSRPSMEQLDLITMTPTDKDTEPRGDLAQTQGGAAAAAPPAAAANPAKLDGDEEAMVDEDGFFETLTRFQSRRMDDQRVALADNNVEHHHVNHHHHNHHHNNNHHQGAPPPQPPQVVGNHAHMNHTGAENKENVNEETKNQFMNMIADFQESRMNDQRAALPPLPGLNANQNVIGQILASAAQQAAAAGETCGEGGTGGIPDDNFFDMLMRCQGARLEDQRSAVPEGADGEIPGGVGGHHSAAACGPHHHHHHHHNHHDGVVESAPTMPDEDFFSLIQRVQSGRIEDQRSFLPGDEEGDESLSNSTTGGVKQKTSDTSSSGEKRSSWRGSRKKKKDKEGK